MELPDDLLYSTDHEWVRREGDGVRVGITDYAQDALGDVVFVELPTTGATVGSGDAISEVESTKSVSEIYSPVSGTVIAVNNDLGENPNKINDDPYGEGWIFVIQPDDPAQVDTLMSADAYRTFLDGE